jgi:hypothetical protein
LQKPENFKSADASFNRYWTLPQQRESPYRLLLEGRSEEAAKGFIQYDFEKTAGQIAAEMAGAPPSLVSRTVAQTRQDVVYFGGLAQLEKSLRDQDRERGARVKAGVARGWFERYLKQFGSVEYTPEDLLDVGGLCARLAEFGRKSEPSPSRRLWQLLDEHQRSMILAAAGDEASKAKATQEMLVEFQAQLLELIRIADEYADKPDADQKKFRVTAAQKRIDELLAQIPSQRAEMIAKNFAEQLGKELNNFGANPLDIVRREKQDRLKSVLQQISERQGDSMQREAGLNHLLTTVLNANLNRRDFATKEDFGRIAGVAPPDVKALFELDRTRLTPAQVANLNRQLLFLAFESSLANPEGNGTWVPGAIRNIALCLQREGRTVDALAALKQDHPALQPIHRRELAAWSKLLQANPKVVLE